MTRIAVLEDDDNRYKSMRIVLESWFGTCLVERASTADDMLRLLKHASHPFDYVCLDHDLGGQFCPSDEKSGYYVVMFITKYASHFMNTRFIIHSCNEPAARHMNTDLLALGLQSVYHPVISWKFEEPPWAPTTM